MKLIKYFRLLILISFFSGLFPSYLKAQIKTSDHSVNNNISASSSDQPYASYWFPLEILSWSPSTDPDAPYNRSGVTLKNKYVDSITVVNPNARVNEAKVNPLSAFAPTSDNPSQGSLNINYYSFSFWQYVDQ
ncbi:glycoside hydrolase, partial [bacterium BMS3Abin03]|nr:glycoside hydrolase [bacterium BMS3Abin03]